MNHLSRFKLVYLQALLAVASAVAGEFGPLKDLEPAKLQSLTWAFWTFALANIMGNACNVIVASFQHPPLPKDSQLTTSTETVTTSSESNQNQKTI